MARGLADELHGRLGADGLACTRVLIAAETEHGERSSGCGGRRRAARRRPAIADRVRWQLDGWLSGTGRRSAPPPTAGITLLELVPDEVVAATGRQLGFWGGEPGPTSGPSGPWPGSPGLLGPDAVQVPEWRGGRSPAEQVALVPAAAVDLGDDPAGGAAGRLGGTWPGPGARPDAGRPSPWPSTGRGRGPTDGAEVSGRRAGRVSGRAGGGRPRAGMVAWAGPWPVEERWWDPAATGAGPASRSSPPTASPACLTSRSRRWAVEAVYD